MASPADAARRHAAPAHYCVEDVMRPCYSWPLMRVVQEPARAARSNERHARVRVARDASQVAQRDQRRIYVDQRVQRPAQVALAPAGGSLMSQPAHTLTAPGKRPKVDPETPSMTACVGSRRASITLECVAPVLADKVREIISTCGSTIWSTVRHTFIAGTRTISQHANGTAVDVHGNPSCIYAMLKGWPGGYTTDYARMNHVHISYGGREHGLRFAHGGGHRHARRYARRYHRYASAG